MDSLRRSSQRRGRALLDRLLRTEVRQALGPLLDLRGRGRHLQGDLRRRRHRLDRLEERLQTLQAELPRGPFEPSMTMDQAWKHHAGAPAIFAAHHLPACDSCAVRFDETLEEAAQAYSIDLDSLLTQLNALPLG